MLHWISFTLKDQGPISDTEPYSRRNEGNDDEDDSTAKSTQAKVVGLLFSTIYHACIDID